MFPFTMACENVLATHKLHIKFIIRYVCAGSTNMTKIAES